MATKKIKGRKRHAVTDVEGNLLSIHVHAAQPHDSNRAQLALKRSLVHFPSIETFYADTAYRGDPVLFIASKDRDMEISQKNRKGFLPLKKRWVIELHGVETIGDCQKITK